MPPVFAVWFGQRRVGSTPEAHETIVATPHAAEKLAQIARLWSTGEVTKEQAQTDGRAPAKSWRVSGLSWLV